MRKLIHLVLWLVLAAFLSSCQSSQETTEFHVSPQGRDNWSGSEKAPFRTTARAKQAVRDELNIYKGARIRVIFDDGLYSLDRTLVFTEEDAPSPAGKVTWSAKTPGRAVFTGAVQLGDWNKIEEVPEEIPENLRERVYACEIPEVNGRPIRPKVLYSDKGMLRRARSEGFVPAIEPYKTLGPALNKKEGQHDTLWFPDHAIKNWSNLADAELLIRPCFGWVMNILSFIEVNEKKGFARTHIHATYAMRPLMFQKAFQYGEKSCWIENIFEAMRETGDWVMDSGRNRIYMVTDGEPPDFPVYAPVLQEFIRLQGDEKAKKPVRNLAFRGLVFKHADRYTWTKEDIGLQHDWEIYNRSDAVFRMTGTEYCTVDDCYFTWCGNTAIRLDGYCQRDRIINNEIAQMGGTGILLCGYGPGHEDVNMQNEVINNHIHHCGLLYWMNTAVFIWQSRQNRVAHNLIHDMPYNGMIISGIRPPFFIENHNHRELFGTVNRETTAEARKKILELAAENNGIVPEYRALDIMDEFIYTDDNIVEFNEIHDVMQVLVDGDAIYLSATGRGNIIRGNYIHDIVVQGSIGHMIRNDGPQFWTRMEDNIIYHCSGGIALQDGCSAINNYIVDIAYPPGAWPMPRREYIGFQIRSEDTLCPYRIIRNVVYFDDTGMDGLYYEYFPPGRFAFDNLERSDSNLFWSAKDPGSARKQISENRLLHGTEIHSLAADPGFIDPSEGDYRVVGDSPLHKLAIKELDPGRAGLLSQKIK